MPATTPQSHRSHVPSTGLGSMTVFDPSLLAVSVPAASIAAAAASSASVASRPQEGA
jgi:hypothetical protein